MGNITRKIYEEIKRDLSKIENGLETKKGSHKLWRQLRSKYSVLIPEIVEKVKESGKVSIRGSEFDYRPELEQLKEVILAYLIINPIDEQSDEDVVNEAKDLLHHNFPESIDDIILEKIEESKIYIRSNGTDKKQIALEKLWDCFERLKTIYGKKKSSVNKLINIVSHDSEEMRDRLEHEFLELTKIGNRFQIRHFETNKEALSTDSFREYLYFRLLSLISYCLHEINKLENN